VQTPPTLDLLTGKKIRPAASFDTEEEAKEWRDKQAALRESTVRHHLDDLKRLPTWFSSMKVSAVTQADALRRLKEDLIRRHLRRSTMLNVVTTVSAAFEYVPRALRNVCGGPGRIVDTKSACWVVTNDRTDPNLGGVLLSAGCFWSWGTHVGVVVDSHGEVQRVRRPETGPGPGAGSRPCPAARPVPTHRSWPVRPS
jgi:hypothetical protein